MKAYDITFVNSTMYAVIDCLICNMGQVPTAYHKQLLFFI